MGACLDFGGGCAALVSCDAEGSFHRAQSGFVSPSKVQEEKLVPVPVLKNSGVRSYRSAGVPERCQCQCQCRWATGRQAGCLCYIADAPIVRC